MNCWVCTPHPGVRMRHVDPRLSTDNHTSLVNVLGSRRTANSSSGMAPPMVHVSGASSLGNRARPPSTSTRPSNRRPMDSACKSRRGDHRRSPRNGSHTNGLPATSRHGHMSAKGVVSQHRYWRYVNPPTGSTVPAGTADAHCNELTIFGNNAP